ncbi:MAG TPA: hypothetical protein VM451_06600 [Candidatus Limnocylindria bacterium]|nr:hypothetical protein [Candidatus Limnocylindria bacterium]
MLTWSRVTKASTVSLELAADQPDGVAALIARRAICRFRRWFRLIETIAPGAPRAMTAHRARLRGFDP